MAAFLLPSSAVFFSLILLAPVYAVSVAENIPDRMTRITRAAEAQRTS